MDNKNANVLLHTVFDEIVKLREAGHKEYAREEEDTLANFRRVAEITGQDQKIVLLTYLLKHIDGIASYCRGHTSQREGIEGRLGDSHVYLFLLRCMIEEEDERAN